MELSYILSIIDEMKGEWYQPPTGYSHRKKIDFTYQSYKHSAIHEIRWYLVQHSDQNVLEVLRDFCYEMRDRSLTTKNGDSNFMFSVYYEVGRDVLDVLSEIGDDNEKSE